MAKPRRPAAPVQPPPGWSEAWAAAPVTEYAYLTPRGEPLCWPVTPYWYPERQVLAIATGVAYPNKAYYARQHPQVAAMLGGFVLQGDATVLDADLQANTDRYIREMRGKFPSARLGLNALSLPFLDFYLPRIWVEIVPVRMAGQGDVAPGFAGAGPPEDARPAPPGELAALRRWAGRAGEAVVSLAGPDGYPVMARTRVAPGPAGTVSLARAPATGPAALTFHTEGLGGVRLDALLARGWVVAGGGGELAFVARRAVGFFGRPAGSRPAFGSIFPLSQLPQAGSFRAALTRELSRRGEPLPQLRVPR
jgi:hypothetical protein